MKKCLFIVNPSSGRQRAARVAREVIGYLIDGRIIDQLEIFYTEKKPESAYRRALSLVPGEYDFVVGVGGDGTISEVASGIYQSGCCIPLVMIPFGTVNDFASVMGLPADPEKVAELIRNFHTKEVDLGKLNDRFFVNVAAGGLLTDVAYKVPKEEKAAVGRLAYYMDILREFPEQYKNAGVMLHVDSEEFTGDVDALVFLIANSCSVGGMKQAVPAANVSDGLLDVLILRNVDLAASAPTLLLKLAQGTHPEAEEFVYFQTKKVKIAQTAGQPIVLDYDGEAMKDGMPLTASVVEKAVTLVIP